MRGSGNDKYCKNSFRNLVVIDKFAMFVYGFAVPIDWETHQF